MYKYLNSKTLMIASIVTAVLYVSAFFLSLDNNAPGLVLSALIIVAFFGWMALVFSTSTIKATYYWGILMVLFSVLIIGALFKIQHWEGASLIITLSVYSTVAVYMVRFITKKRKTLLDVLKLLLVIIYSASYYMRVMHWIPELYTRFTPIIFLAVIFEFSRQYDKMMLARLRDRIQL